MGGWCACSGVLWLPQQRPHATIKLSIAPATATQDVDERGPRFRGHRRNVLIEPALRHTRRQFGPRYTLRPGWLAADAEGAQVLGLEELVERARHFEIE